MSMNQSLLLLVAVVSGFLITVQAQFMGLMDKTLGTKESVVITYASGGLIAGLLALAAGGLNLKASHSVPWYAYTTGILGLVIVGTIGFVVSRLGVVRALTLILVSQFFLAALIDQFGLFASTPRPLDLPKILGLAVMLTGAWLVIR